MLTVKFQHFPIMNITIQVNSQSTENVHHPTDDKYENNIVISQFLECRFNSEFSAIRICLKHLQFYNQIFRSNLFILYQHAIFQFSVTTKCFHYN